MVPETEYTHTEKVSWLWLQATLLQQRTHAVENAVTDSPLLVTGRGAVCNGAGAEPGEAELHQAAGAVEDCR